jgi:hypothetical protein
MQLGFFKNKGRMQELQIEKGENERNDHLICIGDLFNKL